jgi:Domain of unknown function (DUF222)
VVGSNKDLKKIIYAERAVVLPLRPPHVSPGEVTTQMSTAPAYAGPDEALYALRSAMGYLAAADATAMAAETQARCLRTLEQVTSMGTAARTSILAAFTAGKGYCADADYSPRSWLIHRTGVTRAAAAACTAWVRRAAAHPRIAGALGEISESVARTLCAWSDKLPEDCRDQADTILVTAALGGADLPGLAELAARIHARSLSGTQDDPPDDAPDDGSGDRAVRLETTFQGAGVISGDLTPECAAAIAVVLDALSAPADAEDTRTHAQRYHDALEDAMRRLLAAGLVPERAGQPAKVQAHISLADLLVMDTGSALQRQWTERVRAEWAAARAARSVTGSDGAAWLDGDAARAFACDAAVTPVVTGEVSYLALDGLVRLCVELAALDRAETGTALGPAETGTPLDRADADADGRPPATPRPSPQAAARSREALEQAIIGQAVDLLAGPGGLASFLRTRLLTGRLAGPSLPLDVGVSRDIPAAIRQAVILRAKGHCEWAGRCDQPAAACQVHHITHRADGGKTSVKDCALFCTYHHQVVIHRQGWTVALNPDGTTTAWSPDKTKVLRSHGPPSARAG